MTHPRGSALTTIALLTALSLPACAKSEPSESMAGAPAPVAQVAAASGGETKPVNLRKVVRKATLSLEVSSVGAAHARAVAIAEQRGGYVTTANRVDTRGDGDAGEVSSLSLRVPGAELSAVLGELRKLAAGSVSEQIGSEDVTDEVVDLDARLRNQRRLEEQLLELMKTATTVEAALKVHQELGNVRGEIERLDGRRQFLERETTWATINVTFTRVPVAQVSDGFLAANFGRAKRDALAVGEGIIAGGIRFTGIALPFLLLIVAPSGGLALGLRKLVRRRRQSA
jgi:hypothetical protein